MSAWLTIKMLRLKENYIISMLKCVASFKRKQLSYFTAKQVHCLHQRFYKEKLVKVLK